MSFHTTSTTCLHDGACVLSVQNVCGLFHQLYADDVQAYTHCHPDHALTVVQQMCHAMDKLQG